MSPAPFPVLVVWLIFNSLEVETRQGRFVIFVEMCFGLSSGVVRKDHNLSLFLV